MYIICKVFYIEQLRLKNNFIWGLCVRIKAGVIRNFKYKEPKNFVHFGDRITI